MSCAGSAAALAAAAALPTALGLAAFLGAVSSPMPSKSSSRSSVAAALDFLLAMAPVSSAWLARRCEKREPTGGAADGWMTSDGAERIRREDGTKGGLGEDNLACCRDTFGRPGVGRRYSTRMLGRIGDSSCSSAWPLRHGARGP